MAKNYYGRARAKTGNYARKAGGFAKKAGGYAKRGAYYGGKQIVRYQTAANRGFGVNGFKVYPDIPTAVGGFVGLSDLDRMIPPKLILFLSSLPIGGKWGRSLRNLAGGVVLGELASQQFGVKIPLGTPKTQSVTGFYA